MPRTKCKEVYKFEELSDSAKEKAREWYRQGAFDYEWWDCVESDFRTLARYLGWEVSHVYFSGFWSQGDGAQFEGEWAAENLNVEGLKKYAPEDKELHRIADEYARIVEEETPDGRANGAYATVKHRGHYHHSHANEFSVSLDHGDNVESFEEVSRDLMDWLYRTLEKEFEYLNADEQVDESIKANEYEFDEDGRIA